MKSINVPGRTRLCKALILLLLITTSVMYGQSTTYSFYYRVYFRDKGGDVPTNYSAENLLSPRAIERRHKAEIPVPDIRDIPVNRSYLNQISEMGFSLHCYSKWMNTALFKTQYLSDISIISNLPFVTEVKVVKTSDKKSNLNDKLKFNIEETDLPVFDRPITMLNGYSLHSSGFDGKNILIAVLDEGFINADQIPSLKSLRIRKGIKATRNFIDNNDFIYDISTHGTAVLSVLAGKLPGFIEGTATGADYLLLKTEAKDYESPCEEDFWAAGVEYADSLGADIVSSSLGYYHFDNPNLNYKYSDLDGNTSFITKVADIAASKGILVVNSAGNERNSDWKRIVFPADGDSVLAVGAVDGNNQIAIFSSAGPSADGRIKPDNVAMGVSIPVQISTTVTGRSNGTSFSCPVLSGMAACLMQAVPMARNTDIIEALHSSADKYNFPDSLYGYGIPDMTLALTKLQSLFIRVPDEQSIAGPNPTSGRINIIFKEPPGTLILEIFSMTGEIKFRTYFPEFTGRYLVVDELKNMEQGIYFIRLRYNDVITTHKIIKLTN